MSRETRNINSVEGRTRLNNVLIKALIAVALIVADGSAIAIRFASTAPTPSRLVSSSYEAAVRPLIAVPPSVALGAIEVTLSSHQSPPSNSATLAAWAAKNGRSITHSSSLTRPSSLVLAEVGAASMP